MRKLAMHKLINAKLTIGKGYEMQTLRSAKLTNAKATWAESLNSGLAGVVICLHVSQGEVLQTAVLE